MIDGGNDYIGIHMMLPRSLIEELDRHKTRYQSRTSHVSRAIEDYLLKIRIQEGFKGDQELNWASYR